MLINWQRNLGFFTVSYDYFVSALPYIVVAPIYFAGDAEFGKFSQAAIAFQQIFRALSVIVSQFESLTAFAEAFTTGAQSESFEIQINNHISIWYIGKYFKKYS